MIVLSFTLDYRNVITGGMPHPLNCWIFGCGEVTGVLSYTSAARTRRAPG
ncbi:MAG: hypothetical protein AAB225_09895 [Acidobacteriota bacterium]